VGGVLGRLAARKARKNGTRVLYTAHGFHFYQGAPMKNWLMYYPVEKICSFFMDDMITINQEDYRFAKRNYLPG
jgi:glycosyltransferase EpsD